MKKKKINFERGKGCGVGILKFRYLCLIYMKIVFNISMI